ncbi:cilia- and flagella-associated protein 251-like [Papaver somniferum]|uniref:cilia- and flagella-associated protein 251-like n=1 Tax=Papaver somniferum TaxID=3469 RepID=UPI000E705A79|nr:cilia- and flagella-associated protein 251-like [Papaver somniferum]
MPVSDNENKVPVEVPVEENVGASSEANSYKSKYQFARALIEKLRTNATNVLSEEEESLLEKYDAEDREQQPVQSTYLRRKRKQTVVPIVPEAVWNREEDVEVITRDVNMIDAATVDRVIEQETVSLFGESFEIREDAAQTLEDLLMKPEKDSTHGETQQDAGHQHESSKEQAISSSSKPVTEEEQEGDGTELTSNTIKDIKVAEQVESEMQKATSSKSFAEEEQEGDGIELTPNNIEDIKVAEKVESEMQKATSSMPVIEEEQEGDGAELTPNTIEDIKVAERVESEMEKDTSSKINIEQEDNETQFVIDEDEIRKMESEYNKKSCSSSKPNVGSVYYYSAVKMAKDLLELENEQPGFDLGLSRRDNQEKGQGELTAEQRMSNMVTRMQDYDTSVKKKRLQLVSARRTRRCRKYRR